MQFDPTIKIQYFGQFLQSKEYNVISNHSSCETNMIFDALTKS